MAKNDTMLFDLDGSLADYDRSMLRDLKDTLSTHDIDYMKENGISLEDLYYIIRPSWLGARIKVISKQIGWWKELKQLPRGFRVMGMAHSMGFGIHILTKGPDSKPFAWKEKVEWCKDNIPFEYKITITQDKGMVYAKALYDDWPEYIIDWLEWRPRGLVIMPTQPIPVQEKFQHPNVVRWDGSDESLTKVHDSLRTALHRKSKEELKL